jgi:hypothetical protein
VKIFFVAAEASQLQRYSEVYARVAKTIDMLSHQLTTSHLTAQLAHVKSATRINRKRSIRTANKQDICGLVR